MKVVDEYLERFRPVATDIGARAAAYAERIIAQLEHVNRALHSEDHEDFRLYWNGTPAANGTTIETVAANEILILEAVSTTDPAFTGALRLNIDGALRYVALNGAATGRTVPPIRFEGPGDVTVSVNDGSTIFLQFQRVRRRERPKRTMSAGQIQQMPQGQDPRLPTGRHGGGIPQYALAAADTGDYTNNGSNG